MKNIISLIALSIFIPLLCVDPQSDADKILIDTYIQMAHTLREQGKSNESIMYLEMASKARPNDDNIRFDLANAYNIANRNEESLLIYYDLLKRHPNQKVILYNTAYTLKKLGNIESALLFYDASILQDPEYAEAHFSRSLAWLSNGDFERGWPEYEWRWKRPEYPDARIFPQPLWDGSELNGKRIYLHGEQGLGDTFQFIRYARIAKERGGYVIVGVQRPLLTLMQTLPYVDEVVPLFEHPTDFDIHAPLMSLPYILKTNIDTVPDEIPYIWANEQLIAQWAEKLSSDKNIKVGICWNGNSNYRTAALRAVVAAKSIPLKKFARLGQVEGVSIYSLQKETGMTQLNELPEGFDLKTFGNDWDTDHGRFMDTVAIMKNLDLMITVDTSIAHLSAALGVPTWVFIPNPPDWRWMVNRDDSPWYPYNMRLFRQDEMDNWDPVMERVAQELEKFVASRHSESAPSGTVITPHPAENIQTPPESTSLYQQSNVLAALSHLETIEKECSLIRQVLSHLSK